MKEEFSLNKEQLRAVKHGKGPLLIIAGAGTGKTTVITERIKHLVLKRKINLQNVLALTFTEKAAAEMEERVDKAMPYGYTQMWISTFHSFCDRILRNESLHIGLNSSYKLLTESEAILLVRNNLFKFNLNYFRPLSNPHKFISTMISHFSRLKDEDINPKAYLDFVKNNKNFEAGEKETYLELASAYKVYEDLKIKEGVMDFSDLISNTLNLFRKRKNILRIYQEQFEYILVDEFQDTNFAQNELAILLAGGKKNITVVGDDDQSIYRFRGAAVSNIIQFKKRFKNAKIITLIKNYRSTEEILKSSYTLIQHNNPDRLEIKERINKKLISQRKVKGKEVEFIYQQRVENEADEVARRIKSLTEIEKYGYKDIAILVRANDHADSFIKAFERTAIPYQFLGPGRLFHQEEIKDLISYLKVLYNFEDSASLYRVLSMSIFKLEGFEIAHLLNLSRKKNYSLFETLAKTDETSLSQNSKEKIKNLHKMIKKHINLIQKESAGQILYLFMQDSGLIQEIIDFKTVFAERKAKNIAKFFDKLSAFETERQSASVFDVVDWIDLAMQMGESPLAYDMEWVENDAVNILTVHSSKGLEFPVVFIVNLVSQRFPTRERSEKIPIPQKLVKEILPTGDYHTQEERRLFYVAATRAKDLLFLTAAGFYGEGRKERKISPFVIETLGEKAVSLKTKNGLENKNDIQLSLLEWKKEKNNINDKLTNKIYPVNYLSYSQIETFNLCPLHYKLKYILKIPSPQSASQSFGTSVHTVLKDFYQNWILGNKMDLKDLEDLFKKNWINQGYTSKAHEKEAFKKAQRVVKDYLIKNFDEKKLPIALEHPFVFNLGGLKIGGRIDRIDKKGAKIEIIDYKTGESLPKQKDLEKNIQLTFYGLAATQVHDGLLNKKPEEVILTLYYLGNKMKMTTSRTKQQLEEAKKDILEKAGEIAKSDFSCSKSIYCKNCEYKMLCRV